MTAAAAYLDPSQIDETFVPKTDEEIVLALQSWRWRIFSGHLYKIMIKGDDGEVEGIKPFIPNAAQVLFIETLHYRNLILKARQLGFTTLIAILWLDYVIFTPNKRAGINAHKLEEAESIFADKILFAYEQLPDVVKQLFPVKRQTASRLTFKHNSGIRVSVSLRGGTYHRVHISEMGKIAAEFPKKAREIVTGTLPAVPRDGIVVIESTAEGKSGIFYDMATRAEKRAQSPRPLGRKEWKFHFFAWFVMPEYRVPANDNTPVSADQHQYFDKVEAERGVRLDLRQRRWWVAEMENGQAGHLENMWREYPSTPAECWMRTGEGVIFKAQMQKARASGRIGHVPFVDRLPVNTFWDIGAGDGTAIWLQQDQAGARRHPAFIEGWNEGYLHYILKLEELQNEHGFAWGTHYLPHDAEHKRQVGTRVVSAQQLLEELRPGWTFSIVPRVSNKGVAIQALRRDFSEMWFDEAGCKLGIAHLDLYHWKFNSTQGVFSDIPEKNDGHSEAADALMQQAQGYDPAAVARASTHYDKLRKMRRRRRAA